MPTIQVNGTQLAYVEAGQGPPLVLVHGGLGDFRSWEVQLDAFVQHYRTFAYSRRYHYPNPWPDDGAGAAGLLHAADLAALITALDLGRVHVVAYSYGAYVALLLAIHHLELVRSLVLGEPPVIPLLKQSEAGRAVWAEFVAHALEPARQAFRQGQLEAGVRCFLDGVGGPGTFDQIPPSDRVRTMENAPELRAQLLAPDAATYPALTCAELGRVMVPTLLQTGEWSPRLFHCITDELEWCLPYSERVMLSGVSHGLRAIPDAYNASVLAFLAHHFPAE